MKIPDGVIISIGIFFVLLGFFIVPDVDQIFLRSTFPHGNGWGFLHHIATSALSIFAWIIFGLPAALIFTIAVWLRTKKFTNFLYLPIVLIALAIGSIGVVLSLRMIIEAVMWFTPNPSL